MFFPPGSRTIRSGATLQRVVIAGSLLLDEVDPVDHAGELTTRLSCISAPAAANLRRAERLDEIAGFELQAFLGEGAAP